MSSLLPVALYGLEVPPGETLVPAAIEFPATIRITMAAIDPTQPPETDSEGNIPSVPRSTLKLVKTRGYDEEDDEDDEEAGEYLESLIANAGDEEDDEEEDDEEDEEEQEEANGGPSDPAKSKKARREAALKKLLEAAAEDSDEEMENADGKANGIKKGKEKASDDDSDDSDDDDSDDDLDLEEYVVCTLDTERNYQQTLDITIAENERVFFIVSGTHAIHLTGNYVVHDDYEDDESDDDENDGDFDLPPGLEDIMDDSDLSDELDAIERIEEIDEEEEEEEEEEAPKLVAAGSKKGKKRPAEDEAEGLDDLIAKDEPKLSKKQLKKLKNNKGEAVASEKETASKGDKKVQFAKNLEQGPTGPAKDKAAPGVKVVQGVTIDDRKIGKGRTVKSGDKVGMRYIGKLENGKVFDSNKKGAPFAFKVGKGEVIKGWDIGIEGMSVGGERRLTIPAHHAYGSKSLPGIPANSTLIFDVKLLEIK